MNLTTIKIINILLQMTFSCDCNFKYNNKKTLRTQSKGKWNNANHIHKHKMKIVDNKEYFFILRFLNITNAEKTQNEIYQYGISASLEETNLTITLNVPQSIKLLKCNKNNIIHKPTRLHYFCNECKDEYIVFKDLDVAIFENYKNELVKIECYKNYRKCPKCKNKLKFLPKSIRQKKLERILNI